MKAIIAAAGDMNELTATATLPKTNNEYMTNKTRGDKEHGKKEDNGSYAVERKEKTWLSFREFG